MTNNREQWGSKIGFILAASGSAIGLGNIWKFPYIAGENGGGAFVLVYLICIAIIGLPVLMGEILIGRTTKKNPVGAFKMLGKTPFWIGVGGIGVFAGLVILSFYSVIAGWSLGYVVESLKGTFFTLGSPEEIENLFGTLTSSASWTIGYHTIFFILTMGVVYLGVKKGIELSSKIMMPALFIILIILVIRGLILDGAEEGIAFLLVPDWSKIHPSSILIALGHAFFTLSLGMGAMMTYGSYMKSNDNIPSSAFQIVFLDTLIALMAGVAIFTVVFSTGQNPAGGPGLIFQTLPVVFTKMAGGAIFALLFFILLSVAALSSAISLLEVVVAYFVDELHWARHKAVLILGGIIYLVGVPSALSFNLLSDVKLFDKTFFDLSDFLASNILLPVGGLLISVFVGWIWGIDKAMPEMLRGVEGIFKDSILLQNSWKIFIKFVAPVLIFIVFLQSIGII